MVWKNCESETISRGLYFFFIIFCMLIIIKVRWKTPQLFKWGGKPPNFLACPPHPWLGCAAHAYAIPFKRYYISPPPHPGREMHSCGPKLDMKSICALPMKWFASMHARGNVAIKTKSPRALIGPPKSEALPQTPPPCRHSQCHASWSSTGGPNRLQGYHAS